MGFGEQEHDAYACDCNTGKRCNGSGRGLRWCCTPCQLDVNLACAQHMRLPDAVQVVDDPTAEPAREGNQQMERVKTEKEVDTLEEKEPQGQEEQPEQEEQQEEQEEQEQQQQDHQQQQE